jgi:uncharacterized protein
VNELDLGWAFLLGLFGSGHCVGMCGPLVLAMPAAGGKVGPQLLYHGGRITTYAAIGAALGAVGAGLSLLAGGGEAALQQVARIQAGFSVVAALFLLGFGLTRLGITGPLGAGAFSLAKLPLFGRLVARLSGRGAASWYPLGLLMGLLPCGLSFAAFARALATGGPAQGGLLALVFALGTLPSLLLLGTAAAGFARKHRQASEIIAGLLMVGMAVSLALDALAALG